MEKLVTLIPASKINYVPIKGFEGEDAQISRDINEFSQTMGGGFAKFTKSTLKWQIKYDEIMYVVSGSMYIIENGERIEGKAGDVYFMKDGADIVYGTDDEVVLFYTLFPVNWQERNN
jgi:ethanolamine utilization protein EutQ (cupin superfamily)